MDQFQISLSTTRRNPEAVMFIGDLRCKVTLSPVTEPAIKTQKSLPPRNLRSRLVGNEAALYGLRRSHIIPSDYPPEGNAAGARESLNFQVKESVSHTSAANKTPQSEATPDSKDTRPPFLGINFGRTSPVPPQTQRLPAVPQRRSEKSLTSREQVVKRIATVRIGEDLKTEEKSRKKLEQQILEWANYQKETKGEEKLATRKMSEKPLYTTAEIAANFPSPAGESIAAKPKRQVDYLTEILRRVSLTPPPVGDDSFSLLHANSQSHVGFLHQKNHFPLRASLIPMKRKRKVEPGEKLEKNETVGSKHFPFPLSEAPAKQPAVERVSDRHKRQFEDIPKNFPRHRLAVDFNLFRNVFKHKDRSLTKRD